MVGKLHVETDSERFRRTLEAHTDKEAEAKKYDKIRERYSEKYNVEGDIFTLNGRDIHIDYLPTIDTMLDAAGGYEHPEEVIGAALFKIEAEHCLFMTDSNDPNLRKIYEKHREDADKLASELWRLVDEEYPNQFTPATATILSGSFEVVSGQIYGAWRRSLKPAPKLINNLY